MISNDVNVIFYYFDRNSKFHNGTAYFVKKNSRRKYIHLSRVGNSFIATYADYLRDVGTIIERCITKYLESKKRSKRTPDAVTITTVVEENIKKELKELSEETAYTYDGLDGFKSILLSDFSISELYFTPSKIGEFREVYIKKSRENAMNKMNLFLQNFVNGKVMKIKDYSNYNKIYEELGGLKDHEDRIICAELFCFGLEKGPLSFLTYDKKFKIYLRKRAREYRITLLKN